MRRLVPETFTYRILNTYTMVKLSISKCRFLVRACRMKWTEWRELPVGNLKLRKGWHGSRRLDTYSILGKYRVSTNYLHPKKIKAPKTWEIFLARRTHSLQPSLSPPLHPNLGSNLNLPAAIVFLAPLPIVIDMSWYLVLDALQIWETFC